jgi:hypothetical protein
MLLIFSLLRLIQALDIICVRYKLYSIVLSRNDNIDIDNEIKSRHKLKLLDNIKFTDINIITAKDVTVNNIEEILKSKD